MFSILWKTPDGGEEIYVAPSVSKIPPAKELSDQLDCRGREHVAFQKLDGRDMVRTVINVGEVYVMNAQGKTVASYYFGPDLRPAPIG